MQIGRLKFQKQYANRNEIGLRLMTISRKQKIILTFFPLIWLAWFITGTDFMFGITGGGLFLLLLLMTYKMISEYKRSSQEKGTWIIVIITIAIVLSTIPVNILKSNMSKTNALPIIDAIEKYKIQKGSYPQNLRYLVPDYLSDIPKSKMGLIFQNSYSYSVDDNGSKYEITYPNVLFTVKSYSSETKEWTSEE
jgi:hypothetical protein